MLFRCSRGEGDVGDVEKYLTQLHCELSFLIYAYPLNPLRLFSCLSCHHSNSQRLYLQVLIYSPDGRCLFKYSAYDNALGVKSATWSPCGQFLGVGSYDQVVRVLNHLTWKPAAEFSHPTQIRPPSTTIVFKVRTQPCTWKCIAAGNSSYRPELSVCPSVRDIISTSESYFVDLLRLYPALWFVYM